MHGAPRNCGGHSIYDLKKMSKKIVIAGGTGFIRKYLSAQFRNLGYQIVIISRNQGNVQWNDRRALIDAIENSEMLINLAGKSVDCRYHEKDRQEILKSRTETTKSLGEVVLDCKNPPTLWVNSSTATIYRYAEDRPMSERDGEIGTGFSVDVARNWEDPFFSSELILKSRWVIPERLMENGFRFEYPNLETALNDILSNGQ